MVFFSRLRRRLRERRVDRKLRVLEATPAQRDVARLGSKDLHTDRVAIQPLRKPQEERTMRAKDALLAKNVAALVQQYSVQRRREMANDEQQLRTLQMDVPSAKYHIDKWIEKQRRCFDMRVQTDRDLARWMRAHTAAHKELVRVRGSALSAVRLALMNRRHPARPIPSTNHRRSRKQVADRTADFSHLEIWITMVLAAVLAGAYGLVLLSVGLKLVHRI
jgi:hypothetical protein